MSAPDCAAPNALNKVSLFVKLTNTMPAGGTSQSFGSSNVMIPAGLGVISGGSFSFTQNGNPTWTWATGTYNNAPAILLRAKASKDQLKPQESLTFSFTATATGAPFNATWNTFVKQSNDFSGVGNDFTLSGSAPVTLIGPCVHAPVAGNDTYSTNEDTALVVGAPGVLSNDSDQDAGTTLTAVKLTDPAHGSVTLNANGSFTYTPSANYNGGDSFTYRAFDGGLYSAAATVSITVNSVNDPPVASDESFNVASGTALNGNVLSNDTDPDGDTLNAVKVSDPTNGSVTLNSNGSFTYTSNSGYIGSDSFTYKANDGSLDSNVATVSIEVWQTAVPCNGTPVHGIGPNGDEISIVAADPNDCTPGALITASFDGTQLDLTKPDGQPVQVKVEINAWDPEAVQYPVPATLVTPPDPAHKGFWCDGAAPGPYSIPVLHSGESWCLISQSAVKVSPAGGEERMQVTEVWLLDGDAALCRKSSCN